MDLLSILHYVGFFVIAKIYTAFVLKILSEAFSNHLLIMDLWCFRFLDSLVKTLEEKKHHEMKLKEGLKDLAIRRMELQNALSSSWPKQVSY